MAAANEKRIQNQDNQLYNQQLQDQHVNNQNNKKIEAGESSKSIKFNYQLGFRRVGLNLDIPEIINEIKRTSVQQTQLNGHQPQVEKLNASKIPAVSVQIGSWMWASKHEGDLVAKIYYKKKKLVWEFIFGSLKKKIEFGWSQISAMNVFSRENKMCYLVVELNKQPGLYEEVNYHAKKHTQWNTTRDFTDGQALCCRRHIVAFPPRVLNEPLKKMLQCDSNLFNLSRKPFPTDHSPPLYNNNIIDFTSINHGPSSLNHQVINTDHQGQFGPNCAKQGASLAGNNTNSTRIPTTRNESVHVSIPEEHNYNVGSAVPFSPNFVPPGSSYNAGPFSSNLPIPGRNPNNKGPFVPFGQNVAQRGGSFAEQSSSQIMPQDATGFAFSNQQVLEHNRYNQIQDIPVGPNIGVQYPVLEIDQMDLCIPDQLPGLVVMDTDNKESNLKFDPTYKPFTEMDPSSWVKALDGIELDDSDDYLNFMADFDFPDLEFNNGENGVNDQMEFQDNDTQNLK